MKTAIVIAISAGALMLAGCTTGSSMWPFSRTNPTPVVQDYPVAVGAMSEDARTIPQSESAAAPEDIALPVRKK